ncbi:BrnA antitoxin family protein [Ostreibacterium oceani]|uniref:BrnA antitoxin of type II toxin-antitoxin system n=1 Tax=Ostreibacterium oceani TaxID=2654998 RepID=A0A6N7EW66_9GAMM|nr:BrnA antitoxin family protein [Ostreibacterium oceani]MPV87004.1 hypothetical protein [Ostreibacterium oceani]
MGNVKYKQADLPNISRDDIKRVIAIKDDAINTDDIPELNENFWENAELYRPKKQQITIKVDADVLLWLKSNGKGYQTRLNEILRKSMAQSIKKEKNHS